MQRIEISHHQLKRLDLKVTEKQSKAKLKIDTPNLQSFKYHGHRMPLASLISFMNTSSLQEAQIHFLGSDDYNHLFIPQLKEFFEKLKHCQVIKLLIKSKRVNFPSSHLSLFFVKNVCYESLLISVCLIEGAHSSQKAEANFISPCL